MLVAVAAAFHALSVHSDRLSEQSRGTTPPTLSIYRVASMAQLRPLSPEERLRAEFHDHAGIPISDTANKVLLPGLETLPLTESRPAAELPGRQDLLQRAVCRADAVVLGVAKTRRVLLNRSETDLLLTSWSTATIFSSLTGAQGHSL